LATVLPYHQRSMNHPDPGGGVHAWATASGNIYEKLPDQTQRDNQMDSKMAPSLVHPSNRAQDQVLVWFHLGPTVRMDIGPAVMDWAVEPGHLASNLEVLQAEPHSEVLMNQRSMSASQVHTHTDSMCLPNTQSDPDSPTSPAADDKTDSD